MAAIRKLPAKNDFVRHVPLDHIDPVTGLTTPLTTGTVRGFIASSSASNAEAVDPSLSCVGVCIGGANGFEPGLWQFEIDGSALDPDLLPILNTVFGAEAIAYFIVVVEGDVRRFEKLKYVDSLAATIA